MGPLRNRYTEVTTAAAGEADPVLADEETMTEGDVESPPVSLNHPARPSRRGGRRRRQYQAVSTGSMDDDNDDNPDESFRDEDDEAQQPDPEKAVVQPVDDLEGNPNKLELIILDPAQKRFPVTALPTMTVQMLKERGQKVHKVAPQSQRLIFRGKLLADPQTLEDCGLTKSGVIVHLFPKPRVVIQSANDSTASSCASTDGGRDNNSGAHIPQIVLNQYEADQRATILVLGSADFIEAQNNVKLLSFFLLVVSGIELFNLFLILMGVPQNESSTSQQDDYDYYNNNYDQQQDDFFNPASNGHLNSTMDYRQHHTKTIGNDDQIQYELQHWQFSNNFDLIISAFGFYVALLGIRATNEHTARLAQLYTIGTIIVGIAWMMFNYWFTVHLDKEIDRHHWEEQHNHTNQTLQPNITLPPGGNGGDEDAELPTDWEYYQANFSIMMIPGMVWMLCCIRAWQFQSLLEEAEREAEERIRAELAQHTLPPENITGGNTAVVGGDEESPTRTSSDVELQPSTTAVLT